VGKIYPECGSSRGSKGRGRKEEGRKVKGRRWRAEGRRQGTESGLVFCTSILVYAYILI
jgi:hypothetical protein